MKPRFNGIKLCSFKQPCIFLYTLLDFPAYLFILEFLAFIKVHLYVYADFIVVIFGPGLIFFWSKGGTERRSLI